MLWFKKNIFSIAINYRAVKGPWGGASVFVHQLRSSLERCGICVRYDLKKDVDVILMIDPREDLQKTAFGLKEIQRYKRQNPAVKVIHRINECDERKATDFMDEILERGNSVADHTIFISQWLKDYFAERWFDKKKPHSVIYNGADERFFHPVGGTVWCEDTPLRLVTHHWSDNPMKGFAVYQMVDEWISTGVLKNTELWVIGRWPIDIRWKSAKTFPPATNQKLGDLLRLCHIYLTASLYEPCGMHHVEGAQCGLPLLSHIDGGGIVEAADKYGLVYQDQLLQAIEEIRNNYGLYREKVLSEMPSGGAMTAEYVRTIQKVVAPKRKDSCG